MDHSIIHFLQTEAKVSSISQALMASQDYSNNLGLGGETHVHIATLFGLKEVIVDLLSNRDTPDPRDSNGKTLLLYAAAHGYNALVELLLTTYGVDPDPEATSPPDDQGRTPLSFAAGMGKKAVVKLLLARQNVNPNSKNTVSSQTPLVYAAEKEHKNIIKQLLNKGANPKMQLTGSYGREGQTPLSIAAENSHDAIVELFLAHPDVNINLKGESN
ncbi:Ankyrin repeat-containing domain protein, partial [Metarhizium majus ARSEF 297]